MPAPRHTRDIATEITNTIIARLEAGVPPWVRPWSLTGEGGRPLRHEGTPYNGINCLWLWSIADMRGHRSRYCLARLRTRSRKIEHGMRIKLATPMTFTDGHVGDEFVVVKEGSSIRFRCAERSGHYHIRNFRDLAWSVVPETKVHRTVFAPASASATPA